MTERGKSGALTRWADATPEERRQAVEAATAGRQRAARANRLAKHVDEVLAQAGELTPGQVAALRALLPPVDDKRGTATTVNPDGTTEQRPIEGGS